MKTQHRRSHGVLSVGLYIVKKNSYDWKKIIVVCVDVEVGGGVGVWVWLV